MFENLQYAYPVGNLLLSVFWITLLLVRRDLLFPMGITGLLMGTVALVVSPLFYDYWVPRYFLPYNIDEFFYCFFAGGIVAAFYEVFSGKRHVVQGGDYLRPFLTFLIIGLVAAQAFLYLLSVGMLSIYASSLVLMACGLFALALRRDLIFNAFASGIGFAVCIAIVFPLYIYLFPTIVSAWWNVDVLVPMNFLGYPVEELLFAFAFGFSAGPMYKFLAGLKFTR